MRVACPSTTHLAECASGFVQYDSFMGRRAYSESCCFRAQ